MIRIILFLFFFFSFNSYATKLINCDGCSLSQVRSLVYGQNSFVPFTNYYVIDFESESLYFYRLHNDQEMGIRTITPLPITSGVTAAVTEYFSAMNSARENINSESLSEAIAEALGINTAQYNYDKNGMVVSSQTELGVLNTSASSQTCPNSQRLYDYVTTSSLRTQAYHNSLTQSGPQAYIQAFNNAWNNLISLTNATVTTGVVQAKLFTLDTTVYIESAGQLDVTVRPGVETLDVVEGSILDCYGNAIPTSIDKLPGKYVFANLDEAERFGTYAQYLGLIEIQSTYSTCVNEYYQTTCKPASKDGDAYVCTIVIPQCFQ